jgi:hypothetical protein
LGGAGTVSERLSETCEVSLLHVAGGHAAIGPDLEQEMREQATSTGAICEVAFHDGDEASVNPPGTEHEVSVDVTDNAGGTPEDEADVRFQVFRGDLDLGPGEVSLDVEEQDTVTTEDGTATFAYDGPDENATDYIVACTQPISGEDPDTCVEDVAGEDVLVVLDGEPQNVRDDVAADVAEKQWDEGVAADPATLDTAEFCDAADPADDLLQPCDPYDTFGDATGDFLLLTFVEPLAQVVEPEFDASITLTSGEDTVTFDDGEDGVVFLTAEELLEFETEDLPVLGDVVDEIDDDQLLVVIEDVLLEPPEVPDATEESVVDITGVQDADGQQVEVPAGGIEIGEFEAELLDL